MKQCTCGRSKNYPYCDNTHSMGKKLVNEKSFKYIYKSELDPNKYGISENIILESPYFITKQLSDRIIEVSEKSNNWEDVGFYGAKTLEFEQSDVRFNLLKKIKESLEAAYKIKPELQTIYIQKWSEGAFGAVHNDRFNNDGTIGNISYRYAANIFLHSDFTGGELIFPEHNLEINPVNGSLYMFPGGPENAHGVKLVESGTRYTIVSFWDIEGSSYTNEELEAVSENRKRWAAIAAEGE